MILVFENLIILIYNQIYIVTDTSILLIQILFLILYKNS